MALYQPNTRLILQNDPQDFRVPFSHYSSWEKQYYNIRYNRLINRPISLEHRPVDLTTGNYERITY